MGVISVASTSLNCPALKDTRQFTLDRKSMDVINVENTSLLSPALRDTRKSTHDNLLCCELYGKGLNKI